MKKEDIKVGTEVLIQMFGNYKKAVVIEPTRNLSHSESIMVRIPILLKDGEVLVDMETLPDLVYPFVRDEKKEKNRIYISGPISGLDINERREAFRRIDASLTEKGYQVVNPMENGLPDDATTNEHMKRDIELLLTCDCIYMMRRWTHSKGCKVEFDVATAIGLPVYFEETGELIKFV